jgi:6-phosphogluconolactonase (cycloisomerase 2 family)
MMDRRTFSTLLAGSVAAPRLSWAQAAKTKLALYSGVGPEFTHYDVDVDGESLAKRATVTLPGGTQYAWPHPSKKFLYVTSSTGGPGAKGTDHHVSVFAVDGNGVLKLQGEPMRLRQRPIHNSVDMRGEFLLIAYNEPSNLSVHRIKADGSIGEEVKQTEKLDTGIYAHQIRATPSNQSVLMVTRGNNATATTPEDPGSLKVFGFKDGVLTNKAAVQPGNGLGFGPRHLDFHPTQPWVFVSIERQNQLFVYKLTPDGGLEPTPLFIKSTVADPSKHVSSAGPIHVHPNGRFVYLGNRGGTNAPKGAEMFNGMPVFNETSSNIAVFSINPQTGEPTLIQSADIHGAHPRTFSLDPSARMLVAGSLVPVAVRESGKVNVLPAGLTVFKVDDGGKLAFVRKYDLDTGKRTQWWSGMITLA